MSQKDKNLFDKILENPWLPKISLILAAMAVILFYIASTQKETQSTEFPAINIQNNQSPKLFIKTRIPANQNAIILGLTPIRDLQTLRQLANTLQSEFKKISGINLQTIIGASYADIAEGIKAGEIDIAFVSSVLFIKNSLGVDAHPFLRSVRQGDSPYFYYSALVVHKNSNIMQPKDVCGKKIGYTDLDSASGYIYAKLTLLKLMSQKIIPEFCDISKEQFFGGHKQVLEALMARKIDVGAVFADRKDGTQGAWTQLGNYAVRPLLFSEPIPNDGLIIRHNINPELKEQLAKAFIALIQTPQGKSIMKTLFNIERFTFAEENDYLPVSRALSQMNQLSAVYGKVSQ